MSCRKCEKYQDKGRVYYIRFGNDEIGYTNLGLMCCEEHFKLARKKLMS